MEAQHWQDREFIDWTNGTGSDVSAGQVLEINGQAAVAAMDIDNGATGSVQIAGIAKVKSVGVAASQGFISWWDEDGTQYGTSSSTGAAVSTGADGDIFLGTLVADVTAADTFCYVDLNVCPAHLADLLAMTWESVAANKTLDVQDIGKVMQVTADAKTVTLPATSVGYRFIVLNGAADGTALVTVSPNADDKIMGADLAGVNNKDRLNTKATAEMGDFIDLLGEGTDGYYVLRERGTWAAES
jgi:hypothetical protein